MGIHYFFGHYVSKLGGTVNIRRLPSGVQGILFDLNGLIHAVAQRVFLYGNAEKNFQSEADFAAARIAASARTKEEADSAFVKAFTQEISNVVAALRPEQYVIFAVDGVAPASKTAQQRSRRYRDAAGTGGVRPVENASGASFTSALISPGTEFMEMVDAAIRTMLSQAARAKLLPPNTIYSPYSEPGEGEHKAFSILRRYVRDGIITQGRGAHVVYGMDSDLMILAMQAPVRNMYICREDLRDNVSIDSLFGVIKRDMTGDGKARSAKFPEETLRRDFIVLSALLGNDFLPRSPAFHIMVSEIFASYTQIGAPLTAVGEHGAYVIAASLGNFFSEIARREPELLTSEAMSEARDAGTDKARLARTSALEKAYDERTKEFNLNTFRSRWYGVMRELRAKSATEGGFDEEEIKRVFGSPNNFIARAVADYVGGIEWVVRYYTGGGASVNWLYAYRFHMAPLATDVASLVIAWFRLKHRDARTASGLEMFLDSIAGGRATVLAPDGVSNRDGNTKARGKSFIEPVHQLFAITPRTRLPDVLGSKRLAALAGPGYPLEKIAPDPSKVQLYREGAKKDYLAIPVLPEVDFVSVVKAIEDAESENRRIKTAAFYDPDAVHKRRVDAGEDGKVQKRPVITSLVPKRLTARGASGELIFAGREAAPEASVSATEDATSKDVVFSGTIEGDVTEGAFPLPPKRPLRDEAVANSPAEPVKICSPPVSMGVDKPISMTAPDTSFAPDVPVFDGKLEPEPTHRDLRKRHANRDRALIKKVAPKRSKRAQASEDRGAGAAGSPDSLDGINYGDSDADGDEWWWDRRWGEGTRDIVPERFVERWEQAQVLRRREMATTD